jgi:cytoskeletal protein CcmA (bactofilin family)
VLAPPAAVLPDRRTVADERVNQVGPPRAGGGEVMANIGKSIVIKGDLTGEEDLVVEGKVEGRINLPNHRLTIGQGGSVEAEVHAKAVIVIGKIAGDVSAGERLEIQASGIVHGDVRAPRLVVQEGAVLNGSIEMSVKEPPAVAKPSSSSHPSSASSPSSLSSSSAPPLAAASAGSGSR